VSKFYVVGGRAKPNLAKVGEFHGFAHGLIVLVDTETGQVQELVRWETPPDACSSDNPSFVFKAGTFTSEGLWVCSQTELLCYSVPDFTVKHYISMPFFNDLHHVAPTVRGTLLVAVTGLDMVAEVSMQSELLRAWDVLGQPLWTRFSSTVDYRKVVTTKPHLSHPNYVFAAGGDIWVTRFEQKDALCLTEQRTNVPVEAGFPHDGHVVGDQVYFTTVNGFLVVSNWRESRVVSTLDLNPIFKAPYGRPLGWCRGLKILSEDRVVIGFSRIRQTAIKNSVQWVKERVTALTPQGPKSWRALPTRLACIDLKRRAIEWEIDLENFGMNAVFSIHDILRPEEPLRA